jgi:hypothetical protein
MSLSKGVDAVKKSRYLETLAPLIASGSSIRDACKSIGCSEATGYGLASTDEFRQLVAQIRTQAIQQAVGILTNAATKAAQKLEKLLDSADEKIVLAASSKLLGSLPGMQELHELRARIDAIEKQGPGLRIAK